MSAWRQKVNALKDELRKVPGITVTPKHSTIRSEIRRLLGADICADCGLAVVEHSGKLVDGLYCGHCAGVRALAKEGINAA